MRHKITLTLILSLSFALAAWLSQPAAADSKRQKVIDFEDAVVEGMNKRPLDSFNQISEAERRRRKSHLYRKRVGFRSETAETLRALRYSQ